ncbi:hypothetical protein, partial [Klebsiella aerogenes]|uniref:hypothetical protein n=1 Tax=Klebsiella aerogenes TaxID=548 RepID=UPI001CC825AA
NTDDLFVGKTLLHGDVLMWLMKTLLTSGCTNQRGAGHNGMPGAGRVVDLSILAVTTGPGQAQVINCEVIRDKKWVNVYYFYT